MSLVFFMQRMIPGSPADAVLGPDASLEQKQEWLAKSGLDRPVIEQYKSYLSGVLSGDFGRKLVDGRAIGPQLWERLLATLRLAICAFSLSLVIAFSVGIISAIRAGTRLDKWLAVGSLFLLSAPIFISGTFLLWVFAVKLDLFPLTGASGFKSLILPSVTLGAALAALSGRMIRASLLDVLHEDFIRTARAKGLSPGRVYFVHALRNGLLPVLNVLGLQLAGLLGGTVITEQVFTWPGLGSLLVEAVNQRDYNLVSACVVVLAVIHVTISGLVDFAQRMVDPRTVDA